MSESNPFLNRNLQLACRQRLNSRKEKFDKFQGRSPDAFFAITDGLTGKLYRIIAVVKSVD